jgi:hypothetical protein
VALLELRQGKVEEEPEGRRRLIAMLIINSEVDPGRAEPNVSG